MPPKKIVSVKRQRSLNEAEAPPVATHTSKRIKSSSSHKPLKKERVKVEDEEGTEVAEETKELDEDQEIEPLHITSEMKPYYDRLMKLNSIKEMRELLKSPLAHPLAWYRPGVVIHVHNKMQRDYSFRLEARAGRDFHPQFKPDLSPGQMMELGVFEGKYCNDQIFEYPKEWFVKALDADKLRPGRADITVNLFSGYKSRLPLWDWEQRKWIPQCPGDEDVRGWFEWYCRYWLGRRSPIVDLIQIKRWKQFKRHRGQILKNCTHLTVLHCECRAKQRQALLQWGYEPWVCDLKQQRGNGSGRHVQAPGSRLKQDAEAEDDEDEDEDEEEDDD